jgi:hypothetical protein
MGDHGLAGPLETDLNRGGGHERALEIRLLEAGGRLPVDLRNDIAVAKAGPAEL